METLSTLGPGPIGSCESPDVSSILSSARASRPTVESEGASIDVVLFDLGNVLLAFDHGIACRNLATLLGTDAETIRREVFASGLEDRYERGEFDTAGFHRWLCERFSARPSIDQVRRAASDIFTMRCDTVSILAQLKGAGIRTGVLSNTCEAHWSFVTDGRYRFLRDLVDHVVLSYEVRSMKPEPEIYRAAIEMVGVPAERIFFMDDRPENVRGAIEVGIRAVPFVDGATLAEELRRCGLKFNY